MIIEMSSYFRENFMSNESFERREFLHAKFDFGENLILHCHFFQSFVRINTLKENPNHLIGLNRFTWVFRGWTNEQKENYTPNEKAEKEDYTQNTSKNIEYRIYRYLLSALTYRPQPSEEYLDKSDYSVERIWNEDGRRLPNSPPKAEVDNGEGYYPTLKKQLVIENIVAKGEEGLYAFRKNRFQEKPSIPLSLNEYIKRQNNVTNNLKNGNLLIECVEFHRQVTTEEMKKDIKKYIAQRIVDLNEAIHELPGSTIDKTYKFLDNHITNINNQPVTFDVIMLSNYFGWNERRPDSTIIYYNFYYLFDGKYIDIIKQFANERKMMYDFQISTPTPMVKGSRLKQIYSNIDNDDKEYELKDIVWQWIFKKELPDDSKVVHKNGDTFDFREENLEMKKKEPKQQKKTEPKQKKQEPKPMWRGGKFNSLLSKYINKK